ncbi:RNA polymerase sigma-70 factor [Acidobacterium sp. S8]|uniref:RNA polymerase sigma-70 factor n=1 Tax=Acidobacterium sp. S8 TaxID=1641854 RepID=UPI00131A719B|nr:RNA polymerase sigma-70 factor [Acidobacterium sp. S8]
MSQNRETAFLEFRPLLFSLAYRMLGTRADAEDAVQEAYLRWQQAADDEIRSPRAYLTTIVARLSLDALKAAHRKREVYVGPWLPEPIVEPLADNFAHSYEMAQSLSIAFLHLLESLTPSERAAFLLREIFETPYPEISAVLEMSETNCRQLVTRARKSIRDRRRRFVVDRDRHRQMLEGFLAACASGDPSKLVATLEQDAVLYSDGGGKVRAALNPIYGADRIGRFFAGILRKHPTDQRFLRITEVNGELGALIYTNGQLSHILTLQAGEQEKIQNIFLVANPEKLPASLPV